MGVVLLLRLWLVPGLLVGILGVSMVTVVVIIIVTGQIFWRAASTWSEKGRLHRSVSCKEKTSVRVKRKTSAHPAFGSGSSYRYICDRTEKRPYYQCCF